MSRLPQNPNRESGIAVLSVLLAMMLMLILGATLLLTTRVALDRSVAATDSTRALDTAEAGLQTAAQSIIAGGFTAGQTGTLVGSLADQSEYDVAWTANAALPWFTMTSTGYYPNRTSPLGKRRVTAQMFSLNPWDFQYAGGMTGATVNGNVWVQGPFYVNDELLLSGTAGVHGGPLIIYDTEGGSGDGDLILDSNSADIGSAGQNVALFIDGQVEQQRNPNSYYVSPFYPWAPELEFPEVSSSDLQLYRFDYTPSPAPHPWLTGAERPNAVWDVDAGATTDYNANLTFSKTSLPVDTDTKFRYRSTDGKLVGWTRNASGNVTISFDNTTGIKPVLFVDGDLTFDASKIAIRYQGVGTIVASGRIEVKGSLAPVGSTFTNDLSSTNLNGFPTTNGLGLITLRNTNFDGTNTEWLAAALYAGGTASFSHQGRFKGSVVTRLLDLGSNVPHLYTEPGFSTKLPPRMPGAITRINSIIGWTEESP